MKMPDSNPRCRIFVLIPLQHGVAEVRPDNPGDTACPHSKRQISSSTTKVETKSLRLSQGLFQLLDSLSAPDPVNVQGKQMIEKIVAMSNRREHLTDFGGFRTEHGGRNEVRFRQQTGARLKRFQQRQSAQEEQI